MNVLGRLWNDDCGVLVSAELVCLGTVTVVGMLAGMSSLQKAVVAECSDVAGAMSSLDQSYRYSGISSRGNRSQCGGSCGLTYSAGSGFVNRGRSSVLLHTQPTMAGSFGVQQGPQIIDLAPQNSGTVVCPPASVICPPGTVPTPVDASQNEMAPSSDKVKPSTATPAKEQLQKKKKPQDEDENPIPQDPDSGSEEICD